MKQSLSEESKLFYYIENFAGKITRLSSRVDSIPGRKAEFWALLTYSVAHLVMAIFHEPWYDEAVAWQIARCASVRDILFEIPHYEGHPPLWHFILLPFAKLGAPYELSLTLTSLAFAGLAVYLFIWHAPFPRILRLLLPFTYFFFYQYGVISRPYCIMMLCIPLLAISYKTRNKKPGRYTLCLILLCLTSAYGIVIAGGIAIAWVWEIWNRQDIGKFFKTFTKDRRIWWLAALLTVAILLIIEIMPRGDTFATNLLFDTENKNSLFLCLLYMQFGAVADVCLTTAYSTYGLLQTTPLDISVLIAGCFLGVAFWLVALLWGRSKGTALLLFASYGLYAVFAAVVYIYPHHIGITLLILVFWLWVSFESEKRITTVTLTLRETALARAVTAVFLALITAVSLFWSVASCIKDIAYTYAPGREEATFIAAHGLDRYKIMVGWDVYYGADGEIKGTDINHFHNADNVSAYFDRNIFFNFNGGDNLQCYSTHMKLTAAETDAQIMEWSKVCPDILFMDPQLELVYGDSITLDEYTLVYSKTCQRIWKGRSGYSRSNIYVRSELAEELQLPAVMLG